MILRRDDFELSPGTMKIEMLPNFDFFTKGRAPSADENIFYYSFPLAVLAGDTGDTGDTLNIKANTVPQVSPPLGTLWLFSIRERPRMYASFYGRTE